MPKRVYPSDAVVDERRAFLSVFPGVMVAMLLAALDQTILAAAIPAIVGALGGLENASWLAAAYLLAATTAAPVYGQLGDRFGRRRMLLAALAVFIAASALCALAQTMPQLIAARALQGLGGGGLMTLAQALIGESVPPRDRGRYQGYFATVFTVASTAGPVVGGYLTEHLSWRWVFAINLPLGIVAALLALRVRARVPAAAQFRPDLLGTLLFVTGSALALYALASAGHRFPWNAPTLYVLLVAAALALAALAWWERRAADPVIPVHLLAVPAILRSDCTVALVGAAVFGTILYLPLYLQLGRGFAVGESGLLLLPVTLAQAVSATLTGRAISRSGRLTAYPSAGLGVSAVAFLALAVTMQSAPDWLVLLLIVAAAAGMGTVMPAMQIIVQDTAGAASLGAAIASVSVSRSFGAAFGSVVIGAVLFAVAGGADSGIAVLLPGAAELGDATLQQVAPAERAAVTGQVSRAFEAVFATLAAIAGAGAALAASIPRKRI
jgi:EmrB/QacA subfamily drug resistance transporter